MRDSAIETTVTPLATRIRQSFEELTARLPDQNPSDLIDGERALAGRTWVGLAALPRHTFNNVELDAVYGAVVRCYQRGSREIWAPLLLEMLAPALCERATALFSTLGTVGHDDIEQQLVMEVLRSAERMPTDDGLRFTDRRLVREASRRVARWLRRMNRRQHESLDQNSQLVVRDQRDQLDELADLIGQGLREPDVLLVFRADVRGEPVRQLALESRVSEEAMSSFLRRARERLRKQLPSARSSGAARSRLTRSLSRAGRSCHRAPNRVLTPKETFPVRASSLRAPCEAPASPRRRFSTP